MSEIDADGTGVLFVKSGVMSSYETFRTCKFQCERHFTEESFSWQVWMRWCTTCCANTEKIRVWCTFLRTPMYAWRSDMICDGDLEMTGCKNASKSIFSIICIYVLRMYEFYYYIVDLYDMMKVATMVCVLIYLFNYHLSNMVISCLHDSGLIFYCR